MNDAGGADTSMYEQPTSDALKNNAFNSIEKAMEIRNMMVGNNKIRGGMPQTQSALSQLGAGLPYGCTTLNPNG